MKFFMRISLIFLSALFGACAANNSSPSPALQVVINGGVAAAANVLPIQIGGTSAVCGAYPNEPCASITICTPGGACQTVTDLVVDTGSVGIRIFKQALTVPLTQENYTGNGNALAECATFGTGTTWGPVKLADVVLGSEPKTSNVPIQVIDSTYGSVPAGCTGLDTSPATAGFNGILGVGLQPQDCGSACPSGVYYTCSGGNCSTDVSVGMRTDLNQQIQNPVSAQSQDNNGVVLVLPSIPSTGAWEVTGSLILGVGTQSNNSATGTTLYPADASGNFITIFNGHTYADTNPPDSTPNEMAFIDSGSNGLFFPGPGTLTQCGNTSQAPGFFCPASDTTYNATMQGNGGSPSTVVPFTVSNAINLVNTGNVAFSGLDGNATGVFDWGLPFFFGKSLFVCIEGKKCPPTTGTTGPYWAF